MLLIALHVNVWWGTCCSSLCMLMFGGERVVHLCSFMCLLSVYLSINVRMYILLMLLLNHLWIFNLTNF